MFAEKRHEKGRHIEFERPAQMKKIAERNQPVQQGVDPRQIEADLKEIDFPVQKKGMKGDQNDKDG